MSTEAAILKGRGLVANPAFFIIFTLCGGLGIAGFITLGMAWLDYNESHVFEGIRFGAIALVVIIAGLFAAAKFSGLEERLFVILVALFGVLAGLTSLYVVFYLWGPTHGDYLWASLLALIIVTLAPAAIFGERILPLFVAFISGIAGIVSIIAFMMVVLGIGIEQ